jgi:TPR repeat protein
LDPATGWRRHGALEPSGSDVQQELLKFVSSLGSWRVFDERTCTMSKYDPQFQFIQGQFCAAVLNDLKEAKKRLTFAAGKGHSEAQHLLAQIFEQEKSYRAAAKWYRLAAWDGQLASAQYRLGQLYLQGLGVKRDVAAARRWLRSAAEGGNAAAMYDLGVLAHEGDVAEAYAWFRLATARKSAEAARAARVLRASLTDEQVSRSKVVGANIRAQFRRPAKRTCRPKRGPKYEIGSQEVWAGMSEWRTEYSVQQCGDGRWILYVKGEEGGTVRDGPMYPELLPETLEERGLDVDEVVGQLRSQDVPILNVLAQELAKAITADAPESEPMPQSHWVPPPPRPHPPAPAVPQVDSLTYVDEGDRRFYRHPADTLHAFKVVANIGDRCRNLTLTTANGCADLDLDIQSHGDGVMESLVRVHGEAGPDGRLRLTVRNQRTGEEQVVDV